MMAVVPTASVVITNPTHYAVALRYVVRLRRTVQHSLNRLRALSA
jgi:flagellar biosynthesis protein FlhB